VQFTGSEIRMPLRPLETVQKLLLSTTSHFVGTFERADVVLALAWPGLGRRDMMRWSEGPLSRTAFVLAFETPPIQKLPGTLIPEHSPTGDAICSYLAVLYGKRFDSHGALENQGSFRVPELGVFGETCDHRLPQNSHTPRADFGVPLNLAELSRIEPLIDGKVDSGFLRSFHAAAKFYLQALQTAERDPEVAYLNLITAVEIVSNWCENDAATTVDEEVRSCLEVIRNHHPEGDRLAGRLSGMLRQVKRRYVETLVRLCDSRLFDRPEVTCDHRLESHSFRKSIAAAYDLRSRYVHTGTPFGGWVSPELSLHETQFASPVSGDQELDKILAKAPTYLGLERATRYALLRFAEANGAYSDPLQVVKAEPANPGAATDPGK